MKCHTWASKSDFHNFIKSLKRNLKTDFFIDKNSWKSLFKIFRFQLPPREWQEEGKWSVVKSFRRLTSSTWMRSPDWSLKIIFLASKISEFTFFFVYRKAKQRNSNESHHFLGMRQFISYLVYRLSIECRREIANVVARKSQCVELRELCVMRHPRNYCLETIKCRR